MIERRKEKGQRTDRPGHQCERHRHKQHVPEVPRFDLAHFRYAEQLLKPFLGSIGSRDSQLSSPSGQYDRSCVGELQFPRKIEDGVEEHVHTREGRASESSPPPMHRNQLPLHWSTQQFIREVTNPRGAGGPGVQLLIFQAYLPEF